MSIDARARTRPRLLHWAGWIFGVLAFLALLVVAAHLGDIEHFLFLLRSLAPAWLFLAALLQVGTYACVAATWRYGLQQAGTRVPLQRLLPLALAKLFVDQTVPTGGVSGTAFLVTALTRQGVLPASTLAALLANLVGHYAANLIAACAGSGCWGWNTRHGRGWSAFSPCLHWYRWRCRLGRWHCAATVVANRPGCFAGRA
jgi:uncharacterized membrane protein YbhN (UPF0104 family)